ncbi:MAG: hypothetical protein IMF05_00450, partial [Proteobacteria bacterium]|nr:hypothetical protein [Pseudomonadota bacterium]
MAGCGTDIGRTQVRGTPAAGTVGGLHGSKIEGSNDQLATAVVDVADSEVAQFALPKPAPEGEVPAVQSPKELTFEYVYGSEPEAPYVTNADLDSNVSDDSLILAPTVFGAGTVGGLFGSKIERSNDQPATAAVDVAQFTLPKPAPEGEAPAAQVPKELKFEYVYGMELEAPFINNLDLDSNVSDDSIILAPTLFGSVTYRPTDWLETRLEATLGKLVAVHEHELITLPDGSTQIADPTPWSLLFDQVYAKIKLPKVPVEVTVGRSLFELSL